MATYGNKITTPTGRIAFPYAFEKAKSLDPDKEGKYEVTIYIPKEDDISKLLEEVNRVAKEAFGSRYVGQDKLKHPPIKDGDEKGTDHPAYGHWIVRGKSNSKPAVVKGDLSALTEKEDLYGGCFGKLNLTPASYQIPSGWGITFYLNAVQKVKDGEKFAGTASSPEDMFEAFAGDTSMSMDDHF